MKKTLLTLCIIGASTTSWAGQKTSSAVNIYLPASGWIGAYASGITSAARNSADAYQHIGCSLNATKSSVYVTCRAQNATGDQMMCGSSLPTHAEAVKSIGPDSYIYFTLDGSGNCSTVYVANSSMYEVKL